MKMDIKRLNQMVIKTDLEKRRESDALIDEENAAFEDFQDAILTDAPEDAAFFAIRARYAEALRARGKLNEAYFDKK